MISASDFIKGSTPTGQVSKGFVSASEFAKSNPAPAPTPTLGSQILGLGKSLVKGIVEPVATIVARPIQLGAEALGASDQQVNDFTKNHFSDWVAPTPQNTSDVVKDVGRGIQTVALGEIPGIPSALGKTVAGGAAFGAGSALEQAGTKITAKDFLEQTALGAGTGAVLHGAGKLIGKALGKGAEKVAGLTEEEAANMRAFGTKERPPVPEAGTPPAGYTDPNLPKLPAPKTNLMLGEGEKPLMLEAKNPKTSTLGDNFSFTDKADPIKVEQSKALQDYNTKLKSYNQNPTPNKLKITLKAKDVLEAKTNVPVVDPIVPKEIIPTTATPKYDTNIPESKPRYSNDIVKMPNPAKGNTIAKAASDVNAKIVNQGFDELPAEEQARFNSVSRSQQVDSITNLMNSDIEGAKAMAVTGRVPKEIDPQILFNAVKNHASETGNVDLQIELAKSPIASQRSILAQKLGASATLNDPADAVSIISHTNRNIEANIEKKLGKPITEAKQEIVNSIKNEVAKVKVTKQTFQEFVNSIKC